MFLKIRDIVVAKKKPRRIEVYNNLVRYNYESIEVVHYPELFEEIIHSYVDRYGCTRKLIDEVVEEWGQHKLYLRY
jgi:hypothetical protein